MLAPPPGSWRPLLGEILDPPLRIYPSRMRTTRSLTVSRSIGLGLPTPPPMQTLQMHTPPACSAPPRDRMTDTCENIALPKTSFAGGNNDFELSGSNKRS